MVWRLLITVEVKFQKMCGAGNARIVVANGLFAPPLELVLSICEVVRYELPKVPFDCLLVLRGGRDDFSFTDYSVFIDTIVMVKNAARRFRASVSPCSVGVNGDARSV